jgi:hypothetical protein
MRQSYQGLPAASSVQQAIVLAQLMILRDREVRIEPSGTFRALATLQLP